MYTQICDGGGKYAHPPSQIGLKVNPAVGKTVGCVQSEILKDFFFTFLIRLLVAEKDDFSGTYGPVDGNCQ